MKRSIYIDSIALDEAQKKCSVALKEKGLYKPLSPELIVQLFHNGAVANDYHILSALKR
ncbi:MAG: hypothetical protein HQK92_13925 [Nitrospirae bacterium]|nr:hypothetical protein [Nitrospirota bacterium]